MNLCVNESFGKNVEDGNALNRKASGGMGRKTSFHHLLRWVTVVVRTSFLPGAYQQRAAPSRWIKMEELCLGWVHVRVILTYHWLGLSLNYTLRTEDIARTRRVRLAR